MFHLFFSMQKCQKSDLLSSSTGNLQFILLLFQNSASYNSWCKEVQQCQWKTRTFAIAWPTFKLLRCLSIYMKTKTQHVPPLSEWSSSRAVIFNFLIVTKHTKKVISWQGTPSDFRQLIMHLLQGAHIPQEDKWPPNSSGTNTPFTTHQYAIAHWNMP